VTGTATKTTIKKGDLIQVIGVNTPEVNVYVAGSADIKNADLILYSADEADPCRRFTSEPMNGKTLEDLASRYGASFTFRHLGNLGDLARKEPTGDPLKNLRPAMYENLQKRGMALKQIERQVEKLERAMVIGRPEPTSAATLILAKQILAGGENLVRAGKWAHEARRWSETAEALAKLVKRMLSEESEVSIRAFAEAVKLEEAGVL
jgi:hypothetical protein